MSKQNDAKDKKRNRRSMVTSDLEQKLGISVDSMLNNLDDKLAQEAFRSLDQSLSEELTPEPAKPTDNNQGYKVVDQQDGLLDNLLESEPGNDLPIDKLASYLQEKLAISKSGDSIDEFAPLEDDPEQPFINISDEESDLTIELTTEMEFENEAEEKSEESLDSIFAQSLHDAEITNGSPASEQQHVESEESKNKATLEDFTDELSDAYLTDAAISTHSAEDSTDLSADVSSNAEIDNGFAEGTSKAPVLESDTGDINLSSGQTAHSEFITGSPDLLANVDASQTNYEASFSAEDTAQKLPTEPDRIDTFADSLEDNDSTAETAAEGAQQIGTEDLATSVLMTQTLSNTPISQSEFNEETISSINDIEADETVEEFPDPLAQLIAESANEQVNESGFDEEIIIESVTANDVGTVDGGSAIAELETEDELASAEAELENDVGVDISPEEQMIGEKPVIEAEEEIETSISEVSGGAKEVGQEEFVTEAQYDNDLISHAPPDNDVSSPLEGDISEQGINSTVLVDEAVNQPLHTGQPDADDVSRHTKAEHTEPHISTEDTQTVGEHDSSNGIKLDTTFADSDTALPRSTYAELVTPSQQQVVDDNEQPIMSTLDAVELESTPKGPDSISSADESEGTQNIDAQRSALVSDSLTERTTKAPLSTNLLVRGAVASAIIALLTAAGTSWYALSQQEKLALLQNDVAALKTNQSRIESNLVIPEKLEFRIEQDLRSFRSEIESLEMRIDSTIKLSRNDVNDELNSLRKRIGQLQQQLLTSGTYPVSATNLKPSEQDRQRTAELLKLQQRIEELSLTLMSLQDRVASPSTTNQENTAVDKPLIITTTPTTSALSRRDSTPHTTSVTTQNKPTPVTSSKREITPRTPDTTPIQTTDVTEKVPSATSQKAQEPVVDKQTTTTTEPRRRDGWYVNFSSVNTLDGANDEQTRLRAEGVEVVKVPFNKNGKTWYRLQVQGFTTRGAAVEYANRMGPKVGITSPWVSRSK